MDSLDRATQPRDLSGYTDKPGATVRHSNPTLPGSPVRRVPVGSNTNTIANRTVASSQNQAEYAVKRLLTKPRSLTPSGSLVTNTSTTIINGSVLSAPFFDPTAFTWSWVNQHGATVNTRGQNLVFNRPNDSSGSSAANASLYLTTLPSAPYTITAGLQTILPAVDNTAAGICIYNASSTKSINQFVFSNTLFASFGTEINQFDSPTAFNGNVSNVNYISCGVLLWFRIQDDGTNRNYYISMNGFDWALVISTLNTDFITTATNCGVFIQNTATDASSVVMTLNSFQITRP